MTSGSTADRCEFKGEHMCWCSAAASAAKTEKHQFGSHLPKVMEDLSLISSHLPAPCSSFFMFCFKTNFISAIFENELEEKNIKPPLTPSHNVEEESVFGTSTTSKPWSEIIPKSLQERESHAPLRIHSGYSFAPPPQHPKEQHMQSSMLNPREQAWANLAVRKHVGWAEHCICCTACTQIFLWGNWVWSQLMALQGWSGLWDKSIHVESVEDYRIGWEGDGKGEQAVVGLWKSPRQGVCMCVLGGRAGVAFSHHSSEPCQWTMQRVNNE